MEETTESLVGSILLPARTQADWDSVDAILLNLSLKDCQELLRKMSFMEWCQLSEKNLGNTPPTFMQYDEDYGEFVTCEEYDVEGDNPVIIDEEIAKDLIIGTPESRMDGGCIRVTADEITFVSWGKYTGEEFWTSPLTKEFLTNHINNHPWESTNSSAT